MFEILFINYQNLVFCAGLPPPVSATHWVVPDRSGAGLPPEIFLLVILFSFGNCHRVGFYCAPDHRSSTCGKTQKLYRVCFGVKERTVAHDSKPTNKVGDRWEIFDEKIIFKIPKTKNQGAPNHCMRKWARDSKSWQVAAALDNCLHCMDGTFSFQINFK